jgi:16S rRNA (cytosine967-C5)-methyltransferase
MSAISPARKAAFGILLAVERGNAHSHSDDLLRRKEVSALAPADRNLATTLVLGVLRWQIRLDEQLKGLLKRPGGKLDREVRIALRLGAFQLLFLDRIPAHAAIDESVELAKQSGHRFAAAMVNAVLRKLASWAAENPGSATALYQGTTGAPGSSGNFPDGLGRVPKTPTNREGALAPAEELALVESHPAWMVERWAEFYGLDAARSICRHGQTQPRLTLRVDGPAVEAELTDAGIQLQPGALLAAARTVVSGDGSATAAIREGRARVQDEGSQLIAELAACAAEDRDRKAKSILDACAAPGGKTLILAERNPEAQIVACESSPQRLAQLRRRLAAYAGRVECRLADAAALKEESAFDLVLADVPCSGTGTLGRNPEIRHRLRQEDLPRQAERQRDLLRAALHAVRRGGCVVYSTCSLEPEENEQVVAAVLAENGNARQVSFAQVIEALLGKGILKADGAVRLQKCLTPEGALRLLPGVFPSDGFFVALIEKTA